MNQKLKLLEHIAEQYNHSLSHFLVPTFQRKGVEGVGRFSDEHIAPDTLIAVIGGVIVDEPDQMICMPIGNKLYLHQHIICLELQQITVAVPIVVCEDSMS